MKLLKKVKKIASKAPGAKQALGVAGKAKGLGMGLAKKTAAAPVSLLSKKPGLGMAASFAKKPMGIAQGAMGKGMAMGRKAMDVTSPEKIAAGVSEKMKSGFGKGLAIGKATAPGQVKKAGLAGKRMIVQHGGQPPTASPVGTSPYKTKEEARASVLGGLGKDAAGLGTQLAMKNGPDYRAMRRARQAAGSSLYKKPTGNI